MLINLDRILKKIRIPKGEEIIRFILELPLIEQIVSWSKRHSLPGFFKVPIYDVFVFVLNEVRRNDLFIRANSMAYSFFLSIFPSLISLFTLLPYLRKYFLRFLPNQGEDFHNVLQTEIQQVLPGDVGLILSSFIEDLITNPRVGLLSFGFLLAIYFSSNAMLTMMQGFEKSYMKTFKKRTPFRKRLVAVALTFQMGILLISSVVLIIVGNLLIGWVIEWGNLSWFSQGGIYFIRWLVIIMLFYTVISAIYRYGVAVRQKFRMFSPGATLATILSILTSVLFSFYVDNFSQYNKLYGSFGAIIVTMLWLQINSLVLLIGFELNASIAINRDLKEIPEDEESS